MTERRPGFRLATCHASIETIMKCSAQPHHPEVARGNRVVYFFFLSAPPVFFAVPRNSFALFLRCLPVPMRQYSVRILAYLLQCSSPMVGHTLLSAGLLDLGGLAVTDEPVVGLELLHGLVAVVDQGEAGALAATVLGAETEAGDLVLLGLVELGELGTELILGDVRAVGVQDVTVQCIVSP